MQITNKDIIKFMEGFMHEVYEIKQSNTDYKASLIISIVMLVVGCSLLMCSGWKEIFYGIFFVLGSIVLVVVAIIIFDKFVLKR